MSDCTCKPGMERDNCPKCEGTGKRIDFSSNHTCPKCGKRGDGITYKHKKYGCDDNYIDTDRNLIMPDSRFTAWQEANKSEPMTAFDRAWALMKSPEWNEECGHPHYENDDERMNHIMNPQMPPHGEMELNDLWEDRQKDCEQKLRQAIGEITWGSPYEHGNGFESSTEYHIDNPFYENKPLPIYDLQQLLNYLKVEIPILMDQEHPSPQGMARDMKRALVNYYECMGMPIPAGLLQ